MRVASTTDDGGQPSPTASSSSIPLSAFGPGGRLLALLVVLSATVSAGACDWMPLFGGQELDSVAVSPSTTTFTALDQTREFSASPRDRDGEPFNGDVTVRWEVSDSDVLRIEQSGADAAVVSAVGTGEAEVIARVSTDGREVRGTAATTVTQEVAAVRVTPESSQLEEPGDEADFDAAVEDANGNAVAGASVQWSSTDEEVVVVDDEGVATAQGEGMAEVVAAAGGTDGRAAVEVIEDAITLEDDQSVEDRTYEYSVTVGSDATLSVTGTTVEVQGTLTVEEGAVIEGTDDTRLNLVVRGDLEHHGTITSAGHIALTASREGLPSAEELRSFPEQPGLRGESLGLEEAERDRTWELGGDLRAGTEAASTSEAVRAQANDDEDGEDGATALVKSRYTRHRLILVGADPAGTVDIDMGGDGTDGESKTVCGSPVTGGDGGNGGKLKIKLWELQVQSGVDVTLTGLDGGNGGSADPANPCPDGSEAIGGNGGRGGDFLIQTGSGGFRVDGSLVIDCCERGDGGAADIEGQIPGATVTATSGDVPGQSKSTDESHESGGARQFVVRNVGGSGTVSVTAYGGGAATTARAKGGAGASVPALFCLVGGPGGDGIANGGTVQDVEIFGDTGSVLTAHPPGPSGDARAVAGPGGESGTCKFPALVPVKSSSPGGATADPGEKGLVVEREVTHEGSPGVGTETPAAGDSIRPGAKRNIFSDFFAQALGNPGQNLDGTVANVALHDNDRNRVGTVSVGFQGSARLVEGREQTLLRMQDGAEMAFLFDNLQFNDQAGSNYKLADLIGLFIQVRSANGFNQSNPLTLQAVNAEGEVFASREFDRPDDVEQNNFNLEQRLDTWRHEADGQFHRLEVVLPPGTTLDVSAFRLHNRYPRAAQEESNDGQGG